MLGYRSRDFLNFDLFEKGLGIVSMIFQEKCLSCYILLTDQILLPYSFYFSRYWTVYVLQLLVSQVVTPYF